MGNGVLHVSAKDLARGKVESITINNDQNRLSQDDIKKMVEESQKFAKMDKKIKQHAESKLELERLAYSLRTDLNDKDKLGSKLTAKDKETLTEAINKAIKFADESQYSSVTELKNQTKQLNTLVRQLTMEHAKKGDEKTKKTGKTE